MRLGVGSLLAAAASAWPREKASTLKRFLFVRHVDLEMHSCGIVENLAAIESEQSDVEQEHCLLVSFGPDRQNVDGPMGMVSREVVRRRQRNGVSKPSLGAGTLRTRIIKRVRRHRDQYSVVLGGESGLAQAVADRRALCRSPPTQMVRLQRRAELQGGVDLGRRDAGGRVMTGLLAIAQHLVGAAHTAVKHGAIDLIGVAETVDDLISDRLLLLFRTFWANA